MTETLLKVEDLHTHFHTEEGVVKAVNGVDLTVHKGETVCLVGESGCGKSVTALSVMRLIPQPPGRIVQGRIFFEGLDLLALSEKQMCRIRGNRIAMIFQEPMTSLNPVQKVGHQITEAIVLHQSVGKKAAAETAVEMLSKVGIPEPRQRAREYPHQMSGGMRQRAMIAMALSCHPDLIFADEPTTALDVTIQAQILELMEDLKKDFGSAIVLITHDLGVVAEVGQVVAVMYAGQIVEYTDVLQLFSDPLHPYTRGLMSSIPNLEAPVPPDKMLRAIPGMVPSLTSLPTGCAFSDRCVESKPHCLHEAPPVIEVQKGHFVRCWRG